MRKPISNADYGRSWWILNDAYYAGLNHCWDKVQEQEREILAEIKKRMKDCIKGSKEEDIDIDTDHIRRLLAYTYAEIYKMIRTGKVKE